MPTNQFATRFPCSHLRIEHLMQGKPHARFGKEINLEARLAAGKLLGKKILFLPVKVVFYTVFNGALVIIQIAKLIFHSFRLCCRKGHSEVRVVAFRLLDYALLLPLMPLTRIAKIGKMFCAVIYPPLYFKEPSQCSKTQQEKYYSHLNKKLFDRYHSSDSFSRDIKALLHELDKAVKIMEKQMRTQAEKCAFFQEVSNHLLSFSKGDVREKLLAFRQVLLHKANVKQIELTIRVPVNF